MKVWELMSLLAQQPAGQEVLVCVEGTLNTKIEIAQPQGGFDDGFVIAGQAAEVVGCDGDVLGWSNEMPGSNDE